MYSNDKNHAGQDLSPWEEGVNGVELIHDMKATIGGFIILKPEEALAVVYWILHTHFIRAPFESQVFDYSPILNISSPEKQCGKSTLREIIGLWVKDPLTVMNASEASLFRVIEAYRPTLLIDEADTFLNGKPELTGVLNSGYKQDGHTLRQGGRNYEDTKQFSTWSAKCIAGIGRLTDTIESRCITIKLKRKKTSEKVNRRNVVLKSNPNYFTDYKRQIIRFVLDNELSIINQEVEMPQLLDDRQQDNWEGIYKIAKFISDESLEEVRTASIFLSTQLSEPQTLNVQLLEDIKLIMNISDKDRFTSQELVDELNKMEDRPWQELNRVGLKPYALAKLLSEFDIHSNQRKFDGRNLRGYEKIDFYDAFSRYT